MKNLKRTLIIIAICVIGLPLLFFMLMLLLWMPWMLGQTNQDFNLPLGNGYYLSRTNAATCDISKNPSTDADACVPPNIFEAEFHGPIVIGQAYMTPHSSLKSVAGYFVVDIENEVSCYGLKKAEWMKLLSEKYGINNYDLRLPHEAYRDWKNKEIDHKE